MDQTAQPDFGALVPIEFNEDQTPRVDARKVHAALGSQQDFSTWIKARIRKYGFQINSDYKVFHKTVENSCGGAPSFEYFLTLDMAKHVAMVEHTDRGHQVRQYFIECEHQLQQQVRAVGNDDLAIAERLISAIRDNRNRLDALEQKVETLALPPPVNYVTHGKMRFNDMLLYSLRSSAKMTLEGVAKRIDVHTTTVHAWESGRHEPGRDSVLRLAMLFGVRPENFWVAA